MSEDFQRLLEGSLDARVRQVLGAGLDDGPSPDRVRSAAAALGLPTGAATLAQASASAGAAAAGKPAIALIALKWLGIGALLGGVTATASVGLLSPRGEKVAVRSPAPAPRTSVAGPAKRARALRPAAARERATAPEPARIAVAATRPAPSGDAAPQASVASFAAAPADTLRDEIALLDQARRALRGGNASAALAVLDRYRSTASKHALGTEALLLRVEALVRAGRLGEARTLGRGYIARHPHDGYATRLRRLLGIPAPATAAPDPARSTAGPARAAADVPPGSTPTTKVPTASF